MGCLARTVDVALIAFPGAIAVGGLAFLNTWFRHAAIQPARFFCICRIWPNGITSCIPCKNRVRRCCPRGLSECGSLASARSFASMVAWQLCSRALAFGTGGPAALACLIRVVRGLVFACGATDRQLHLHLFSALQVHWLGLAPNSPAPAAASACGAEVFFASLTPTQFRTLGLRP